MKGRLAFFGIGNIPEIVALGLCSQNPPALRERLFSTTLVQLSVKKLDLERSIYMNACRCARYTIDMTYESTQIHMAYYRYAYENMQICMAYYRQAYESIQMRVTSYRHAQRPAACHIKNADCSSHSGTVRAKCLLYQFSARTVSICFLAHSPAFLRSASVGCWPPLRKPPLPLVMSVSPTTFMPLLTNTCFMASIVA